MLEIEQKKKAILEKIFSKQKANGCWKEIDPTHKNYPNCLHYVPTYNASLWVLILLADLECDPADSRIATPLYAVQDQLFDEDAGIYSLKEDHYPIPCLNGNMLYLDCYFNGSAGERSLRLIDFFAKEQRFDDGTYIEPKSSLCSNKSCFGQHTCFWGVVKLFKGLTFLPKAQASDQSQKLKQKCIDFILLHHVCFSSRRSERFLAAHIDRLTFPNMYKADFLEILWLLTKNKVKDSRIERALDLLRSKQIETGSWPLERKIANLPSSIGQTGRPNVFITKRANEVLAFY